MFTVRHFQHTSVIFSEDDSKKRAGNSTQNFSFASKVALNMIQHHKDIQNRGAKKNIRQTQTKNGKVEQ
jgi:predicted transposase YbfD/YdcC